MPDSVALRYKNFIGINNVDDPIRLHQGDLESGLTSLVAAVNVDIDDKRMLSRRGGQLAPVVAGVIHSMWANDNEDISFFVEGTELKQRFIDDSTNVVKTGLTPGLKMSYVEINNIVAVSNGQIIGYIEAGAYVDFDAPDLDLHKVAPKAGHLVEFFQNKLLVAVAERIYFSDSIKLNNFDDKYGYHQFHGVMSMMKAVPGGVWASDSKNTYFLAGRDFAAASLDKVADYMAISTTAIKIEGEELGLEGFSGDTILWASEKGICAGSSSGIFVNLTKRVYSPGSTWNKGAGFFRRDKGQYITSIHD